MSSAGSGILTPSQLMNSLGVNPAGGAGLLFSAEMVNYTPLMLGGHDARHYRCLDPGCSTREPSPGLVAQAIKARARWLARATVATLPGCLDKSHRGLEQSCAQVRVRLKGGKELELGLVELMFGTIRGPQLASPFSLSAVLHGAPRAPPPSGRYGGTRVNTITRGKSNAERALLQPWPERSARVHLEARLAPHAEQLLSGLPQRAKETLPCLYTAHVLAAPLIAGIGKAVTRGFGRFRYESISLVGVEDVCSGETLDELERLHSALHALNKVTSQAEAKDVLKTIVEVLAKLWCKAGPGASMPCGAASSEAAGGLTRVPSFASYRLKVVEVCSGSVGDTLKCINNATQKSTWKSLANVAERSGVPFHTWPLGLPRHAEGVRCKCDDGSTRDKAGIYGYIVAPSSELKRQNDCLENDSCKNGSGQQGDTLTVNELAGKRVVVGSRQPLKAKDVRHQSLITLFPLPSSPSLVAVIGFNSYSMNLGVDHSLGRPQSAGNAVLVHLGGHTLDNELPPCCKTHVVTVSHILQTSHVDAPPNVNVCCGGDPGGIWFPDGSYNTGGYRDALNAAFGWVVKSLENCGRCQSLV